MRTYWLKIILGALAIFAVGLLVVTGVRRASHGVHELAEGSGNITIPLPFGILPFKVDGERIGSIERVTLERSAPKVITSLRLEAKLDSGVSPERLAGCALAGHRVTELDETSTFECVRTDSAAIAPEASAGKGDSAVAPVTAVEAPPAPTLEPFGVVIVNGTEIPLLLTPSDIAEFQDRPTPDGPAGAIDTDSLTESINRHVDSAMRSADSAIRQATRMADSIRRARTEMQPPPPP
jgi:hypothetical protein